MPELPDIVAYIDALEPRITGQTLERVRIASPFLLRTATPASPMSKADRARAAARRQTDCHRRLEGDLWLVLHLMIAGTAALASEGREARRAPESGGIRFSGWHAHAD